MMNYFRKCCLCSVTFFILSCSSSSVKNQTIPITEEIYRAEFQFKYTKVKTIKVKNDNELVGEPLDDWLYFKVYFELNNGSPAMDGENLNSASVGSPYQKFITQSRCDETVDNYLCIPSINLYIPISNLEKEHYEWENSDKSYVFSNRERVVGIIRGVSSTIYQVEAVPRNKDAEKYKYWLSDKLGLIAFTSENHSWLLANEESYGIGALTLNKEQKVVNTINMKKFNKIKFIERNVK